MLGNAMGMTTMSSSGIAAAPPLTHSQLAAQASSQFNSAYNTYKAQQTQAALYNQALQQQMAAGLATQQHKYMINGRTMNFEEFLTELCPDPEDPMRTFLTLKYKGMEK